MFCLFSLRDYVEHEVDEREIPSLAEVVDHETQDRWLNCWIRMDKIDQHAYQH